MRGRQVQIQVVTLTVVTLTCQSSTNLYYSTGKEDFRGVISRVISPSDTKVSVKLAETLVSEGLIILEDRGGREGVDVCVYRVGGGA